MHIRQAFMIPTLLLVVAACGQTGTSPEPVESVSLIDETGAAVGLAATGVFTQTSITSLETSAAGPNTIISQRSEGSVSGTISGTYEDELRVVIHPNGNFNTHFTIWCSCEVDGVVGEIELVATDAGRLTGPTTAEFAGKAIVVNASGGLTGLRGVLDIEGSVDLVSGLSTYDYSGTLR